MEVTRDYKERERCYNYYFHEGNKIFSIIFGGNLDLYWTIHEFKEREKNLTSEELIKEMYSESKYKFVITKENYFVYRLFEDLYNDVKDSKVFIPTQLKTERALLDKNEIDQDLLSYINEDEENEKLKKFAAYQMLFDGETIEWHSDDDMYDRADRVIIKKVEDVFILEFISPKIEDHDFIYRTRGSASIRFRNSGSIYAPYNLIFMRMFNKLQEYDPECHQVHIEELSYYKKLALKK